MKRRFHSAAWLLLGLLAVSAVLISIGKREEVTDPRIDSYGPSGVSAFSDLLRSNGYSVTTNTSSVPVLDKDDVAVVILNEEGTYNFLSDSGPAFIQLTDFAKKGGHVIVLPLSPDFSGGSRSMHSVRAEQLATGSGYPMRVRNSLHQHSARDLLDIDKKLAAATLWREEGSDTEIAALVKLGDGLVMAAGDGYIALNRFIDKDSNADALMNMVATVAPKGSRLVFTEATYTGEDPGLIDILGPGASGAWYQLLFFLFPVVIFTLGKRFGLAEEVRATQTGQRELVNAIADTYRRARSTRTACRSFYDRSDAEVRKALRLSSDAPASERDLRIPQALSLEFKRVFEGAIDALPAAEAFERCRALQRQVKIFLGKGA